eukprot:6185697-Pleurochrysis_carterae.AAC.1
MTASTNNQLLERLNRLLAQQTPVSPLTAGYFSRASSDAEHAGVPVPGTGTICCLEPYSMQLARSGGGAGATPVRLRAL